MRFSCPAVPLQILVFALSSDSLSTLYHEALSTTFCRICYTTPIHTPSDTSAHVTLRPCGSGLLMAAQVLSQKKTPQQRELESLKLSNITVQTRHLGRIEIVSHRSASPNACGTRDDDPMAPGGDMASTSTGACFSTYGTPSERTSSPRSRTGPTNHPGRDENYHYGNDIPGREGREDP